MICRNEVYSKSVEEEEVKEYKKNKKGVKKKVIKDDARHILNVIQSIEKKKDTEVNLDFPLKSI